MRGFVSVGSIGVLIALTGCGACPKGLTNTADVRLYFGGSLTDSAWNAFAADVLTPAFPDGFTVYETAGQWRDPASGRIVRERTRVVEVLGPGVVSHVGAVEAIYRARFHQVSVGEVSQAACAAF